MFETQLQMSVQHNTHKPGVENEHPRFQSHFPVLRRTKDKSVDTLKIPRRLTDKQEDDDDEEEEADTETEPQLSKTRPSSETSSRDFLFFLDLPLLTSSVCDWN